MRDECNTTFAADAFARLTHRVGVCNVTVGPGCFFYEIRNRISFRGTGEPFRWGNTDFATVGQGFGCLGIRVQQPQEIAEALGQAMTHQGPAVVDVAVSGEELPSLPIARHWKRRPNRVSFPNARRVVAGRYQVDSRGDNNLKYANGLGPCAVLRKFFFARPDAADIQYLLSADTSPRAA